MPSSPPSTERPPAGPVDAAELPIAADVVEAAARLAGHAVVTPLLESPVLNERVGGRLLIKPEMLQRTGSFKFRGAFNRISRIAPGERARGIVAYSSGNHAQGVAAAAALTGVRATILMPGDAPAIKVANTRALGAEIRSYDRATEDRKALAEDLAAERGATLIRPYDDRYVIAGQGTVGLELADQCADRGLRPDAVLVPCGGGGLIAGCALALSDRFSETMLYSVEPRGFDDTARSLAAGRRLNNEGGARSVCDALLAETPGSLTFAVNSRLVAGGLAVDDDAVFRAMAQAFAHLKLVAEPSGAVALAAALEGLFDCRGKTVAVVCSAGNVDPDAFCAALSAAGAG